MAKRTVTTLIDDIDGSEASETIAFAYRGTSYTIDLSEKNAAAFDKAIKKYLANADRESVARGVARRGAAKTRQDAGARRTDLAEIRAWAAENGYEVSSRGRIAADVVEAYDASE